MGRLESVLLSLHLLLCWPSHGEGRRCDLGASDVLLLVHATHQLSNDQLDDMRRFLRDLVSTFDIGLDEKVGAAKNLNLC